MRGLFFVIYFFSFVYADVYGSADDTSTVKITYPTSVRSFSENDFLYGKIAYHFPDSSLYGFDRANPDLDNHYNYLSTLGSAAQPQEFNFPSGLYTFTGNHSYDLQLLIPDSLQYYQTNKKFTELQYHSSVFKEQRIGVFHTQNVLKNWNVGLIFDRQGVKDFMNFSDTFRSRFGLFTWYHTSGNKYNLFAAATWNSILNDVNGGLSDDSLFNNTNVSNLGIKGLAYNLSNASEHLRQRNLYVSQYFDLGKATRDTSGKIISQRKNLRINHEFSFERKSYTYEDTDADSAYFHDFFYSQQSYDTLHSDEIRNKLSVQIPSDTNSRKKFFRNWSTGISAEYEIIKYAQRNDTTWNNLSVGFNTRIKGDSTSAAINAHANYVVNGFDNGNYSIGGILSTPNSSFGALSVNADVKKSSADFIYRSYDSNNFRWNNNFSKIDIIRGGAEYLLAERKLRLIVNYFLINNYVYLNEQAVPIQLKGNLNVTQFILVKNFSYRNWHLNNSVCYQKTDSKNSLHLSPVITDNSLFLEKKYFNNALLMATGLTLNYNTAYNADAFMPATGLFYLQENIKTAGYYRIDLFINAKIKTARIFIRVENIADDLIKRSYYLTPHYPMPGRVIKFGVNWRFFDQ